MKENYWIIQNKLRNPKNLRIANKYLETMKYQSFAEQTIFTHKGILENFLLDQAKDIEFLELNDLRYWLNNRLGTLTPSTYNFFVGILRGFFAYCQNDGLHKPILPA